MTKNTLTLKVRVSWWIRYYLAGVSLCALLTGATPDFEKVHRVVMRGIHIEI